jgi:sugar/nucleoside kinase (ribokinase family)
MYYNTPIILDTKKPLGNWSAHCIVKINSSEFEEQKCHNREPWKYCKRLIVTRGGDGCDVFERDGTVNHYNGFKVDVADIAGCGDSFLSAYIIGHFKCKNATETYNFSNYIASLAASKHGVVAINENEVDWHNF